MRGCHHVVAFGAALALLCGAPALGKPAPKADKKAAKPAWDVEQPKVASRQQTIDVQTGTWMSLDVSPDGKKIVFDLLGDLYVMPITGGRAKALTHSLAWDMQPRFSPDGRWIAFTSDQGGGDNIWVMPAAGGKAKQVTKEDYRLVTSPAWSPDSEWPWWARRAAASLPSDGSFAGSSNRGPERFFSTADLLILSTPRSWPLLWARSTRRFCFLRALCERI